MQKIGSQSPKFESPIPGRDLKPAKEMKLKKKKFRGSVCNTIRWIHELDDEFEADRATKSDHLSAIFKGVPLPNQRKYVERRSAISYLF
jgi:hypothetical protein